jgi:hypothetical protein
MLNQRRAREGARIREPQVEGDFGERAVGVAQEVLGDVRARLVEQPLERRARSLQAPLQGARRQADTARARVCVLHYNSFGGPQLLDRRLQGQVLGHGWRGQQLYESAALHELANGELDIELALGLAHPDHVGTAEFVGVGAPKT